MSWSKMLFKPFVYDKANQTIPVSIQGWPVKMRISQILPRFGKRHGQANIYRISG